MYLTDTYLLMSHITRSFAGAPSSRMTGADITGQSEEELPMPTSWLVPYAESKALAEQAVTKANQSESLTTITVAPHQIYGPNDRLFLGKILSVAGRDQLHIFGKGDTTTSVTFVDNCVHGLLCALDSLEDRPDKVGGGFYIVTDDHNVLLWNFLNTFVKGLGFADLESKVKLPAWLLYTAAYLANIIGSVTGRKLALSPFNVKMLTMHRYFNIQRAQDDLQYTPIVTHDKAVTQTLQWFQTNWLPQFQHDNNRASAKPESEATGKTLE